MIRCLRIMRSISESRIFGRRAIVNVRCMQELLNLVNLVNLVI
jgi:hypothetical protein